MVADVAMAGNGALAGLVSITAPVGTVTPVFALVIGLVGGVIVVFSVLAFDKIKIDDPVGAVSVHGTCGIWGTLKPRNPPPERTRVTRSDASDPMASDPTVQPTVQRRDASGPTAQRPAGCPMASGPTAKPTAGDPCSWTTAKNPPQREAGKRPRPSLEGKCEHPRV